MVKEEKPRYKSKIKPKWRRKGLVVGDQNKRKSLGRNDSVHPKRGYTINNAPKGDYQPDKPQEQTTCLTVL